MEITVERMVPILVVLRIECRVPVPAEVYRYLQAHQTVEQCDREVRGQVRGVVERLEGDGSTIAKGTTACSAVQP